MISNGEGRGGVGVNVGVGVARLSIVGVMVGLGSVNVTVGFGRVGVRVGPARIGGPSSNGGTVNTQNTPIIKAATPATIINRVRGFIFISFGKQGQNRSNYLLILYNIRNGITTMPFSFGKITLKSFTGEIPWLKP
jgi:hypothetical protein